MPELPEVETVRRGLAPVLEGQRFTRVLQRRPDLRFPFPENFPERLRGRKITSVDRRAKYLLVRLDDGQVLIGHLGMSGRMTIFKAGDVLPEPGPHDHVVFETDGGTTVVFTDPRRFGFMDLVRPGELDSHKMLAKLGPEPLSNAFNGPALAAALKGRNTPIKAALLDQRVVAGLGNIYVSEALFRSGLSPRRKARTVQGGRAEKLAGRVRDVLLEAIEAGGSSLRDHRQTSGELGYFQHSFAVYGRAGQACPGCDCDMAKTGGIKQIVQSGRSTFYCAQRQR
ncbi:MAG: bifunctional DNA-formamidopyrimidine glycosylase/DNA-(apurinic or apyrimidinic site) lyase [Rhodospirillaceae bacterium]|jgi:formamidopyrimidine-DNA glycosylase|nr:bifunctional DNA-formamidopyrimidine glycosylase/DNA-(apurinic or apyrimidinic site) lyase [Rhodospirillaceae bacterium]MBT7770795.1 bifunctional DNA-formamidopyrimidine glycosylase/DNA-(apurinic or apyrimidinic site) lyase [Rhodospirillales bacterium]MBT4700094.1 bifunctional DNA-formamidopyrimidine glycosylase/DNA-(apurinic or apyrimidinic site) lyase [Rhodospirillaceae bacterium]MBT5035177.1 bifunctional DNA-formamidopyrimidine glycosylase/DNA-(apurinic or apyrimidinic site) lyase [Rhodosp